MPQLWSPDPLSPGYLSVDRSLHARAKHMKLTSWAPRVHPRRRRTSCQRLTRVVLKHSLSKTYTAGLRAVACVSGAERAVRHWGSLGLVPVARAGKCTLPWWATDTQTRATLRGAQHVKNSQKHAVDRHLILCLPFFSLHDDEASRSRSWL